MSEEALKEYMSKLNEELHAAFAALSE